MSRTYLAQPTMALGQALDLTLWWKRPLDLALGTFALLLALPLIAVLALVVVLESPGPAFFGQERVGYHGRTFRMWKLRTDTRVTRVGHLLRRAGLDELP